MHGTFPVAVDKNRIEMNDHQAEITNHIFLYIFINFLYIYKFIYFYILYIFIYCKLYILFIYFYIKNIIRHTFFITYPVRVKHLQIIILKILNLFNVHSHFCANIGINRKIKSWIIIWSNRSVATKISTVLNECTLKRFKHWW